MNRLEWQNLGTFQLTTTDMVVSDPSYKPGTWCAGELHNCVPGEWEAMVGISDEGKWGRRVAVLAVRADGQAEECINELKANEDCSDKYLEIDFEIGVDSGQAGFFDKALYQKDAGIDPDSFETDFSGWGDASLFYKACCDQTLSREGGVLHCGAVSRSGYGDGCYSGYYHVTRGLVDMAFIQFL